MAKIYIELGHLIKGLKNDLKTEKGLFVSSRQSPDEYGASIIRRGVIEDLISRLYRHEEDLFKSK